MPIPTWSVGQVLAASDVNNWFVPLAAAKAADTSRSSNITPSNDPDLSIALAASAVYTVQLGLMYACASSGVNLRMQFTVPTGATGEYVHWYWSGSTTFDGPANSADLWTAARLPFIDTGGDMGFTGHGTIFTSSTAGNLTLQWAQSSSNATAVTMRKGSFIVAQRIG